MFIALIPFSTAMIGEYHGSSLTAVLFYGTNLFILVLGSNILWWYVVKNKHLLNKDISPGEIMQFKVNGAMPAILLLLAIGLSFINPYIGIGIYILLILWIIIGQLASKTYHPDGEKI